MIPLKRIITKSLGEILVERKIITERQVHEALDMQKKTGGLLGEILVLLGYVTEEDIIQVLAAQYGFPYLPLSNYEIHPEVIKLVPKHICEQYILIPIDHIYSELTIAMANPLNQHAIEDVETYTNYTIQIFLSTPTEIKQAIKRYYK